MKYIYKAYKGGAGPLEEETHNNNMALMQYCVEHGLSASVDNNPHLDNAEEVKIVKNGQYLVKIGYDRWGYCDSGGTLDQSNWEETIKFIGILSKSIVDKKEVFDTNVVQNSISGTALQQALPERFRVEGNSKTPNMLITDTHTGKSVRVGLFAYREVRKALNELFGA